MKTYLLLLFTALLCLTNIPPIAAQQNETRLAQQYYSDGEYEKAASLYERLFEKYKNDYYYGRYISCLILLENFKTAESSLKKQIKKFPKKGEYHIHYGNLLEKQFQTEAADEEFRKAIKLLNPDRNEISRLASAFRNLAKYDLAIETYDKGGKLLKDKSMFAYNTGDLYRRKGDMPKMIQYYLDDVSVNVQRVNTIQTYFQRYLDEKDFASLKTQLYTRIQEEPDVLVYPEMLVWMFIQQKDFKSALRQVKALDRRLEENGNRVFNFGHDALIEKDYETAIKSFEYIVEEKGTSCVYYLDAKRELLNTKKAQLTRRFDYTVEDIRTLEREYLAFLDEFGRNKTTAGIIRELARLQAFYLQDMNQSVELLEEMIQYPGVNRYIQAESKLDLGDFYLIKGDPWESTLLYSQVDKAFKDDILGDEARFRNAKLAYYNGDFEWAQAQLQVLKASTSELIANDAIDLSVFIMDHWSLDTTGTPMAMFAQADLLMFQNRFEESFVKLDSIPLLYPNHGLLDDIYYIKSQILTKERNYEEAAMMLQQIIDGYPEDIRADNAIFDLAELNELHLGDPVMAKDLYGKILKDYSGSTLAVEARKRFRRLRGDDIQ